VVQALLELNQDPTWVVNQITALLQPDASTPSQVLERRAHIEAHAAQAAKDLAERVKGETEQLEREEQRRKDRESEIAQAEAEIKVLGTLKGGAKKEKADPVAEPIEPAPVEP
jgi:phage-related minor tail protein